MEKTNSDKVIVFGDKHVQAIVKVRLTGGVITSVRGALFRDMSSISSAPTFFNIFYNVPYCENAIKGVIQRIVDRDSLFNADNIDIVFSNNENEAGIIIDSSSNTKICVAKYGKFVFFDIIYDLFENPNREYIDRTYNKIMKKYFETHSFTYVDDKEALEQIVSDLIYIFGLSVYKGSLTRDVTNNTDSDNKDKINDNTPLVFEMGHYYAHTTGSKIHICGSAHSIAYGETTIAENEFGNFIPVGTSESYTVNYHEITKEEFVNKE